ncbi:hypothetical protein [Micromonospora sp. HM5-17]|jgi:hypothetical protein|uniref:hypothetical protein n=1 Tax=Micromonospora sp. HM5-17 TaxID=2487710 RepID=UPI000F470792|nr:hypothetical protein [Micromonospora sp. HM5-17]ROT32323.1 hypothetical protein EF879_12175 [Micromonospora sp. HM5-17]
MTQSASTGATGDGHGSKTQVARQGAAETGQRISQAGSGLAHSAADRGRGIAREAGQQAQNLMGQAAAQLREQAGAQQQRAADGLRSLGDQLRAMSDRTDQPGLATDLVRQAADRVQQAAQWLDQREPGMVLEEVREYARRRPGIFLAGAALAGVIAGRLTRSGGGMPGGAGAEGHPDGMRQAAPSGTPPTGQLSDAAQRRLGEMEQVRPSEPVGDGRVGEVRR